MCQPSLIRPLIRLLRLPRPLYPPLRPLIRARLRLPILPQKRLVRGSETGRVARLAGAAPDKGGAGVGPVVARTDATAVEVFGAVVGGRGPFADDEPEGEGGELGGEGAGVGDVLGVGSLVFLCVLFCEWVWKWWREVTNADGKHLVEVCIHHDALKAGRRHEPLPVAERLEGIVDD